MARVLKKKDMETLSGVKNLVRPVREEDLVEAEDPTMVEREDMVTIEDRILAT